MKDLVDPRFEMIASAEDTQETESSLSPLCEAVINGDLQLVKTLIEEGANPLYKDISNDTLLHLAASWGQYEIL